ncbi:hypothetical protein GmRootA79_53520 (plasmid) [Acidovorax sp. A79]
MITVVEADDTGYHTQSISVQACAGGSLGPAQVVDNTPTPIAPGMGAAGTAAVETYIRSEQLPPGVGPQMRVGLFAAGSGGITGEDALLGPILLAPPPPGATSIPTMSMPALLATALLLAAALWLARRQGWAGLHRLGVALLAVAISGQLLAAIVRDGLVADWTGVPALASDAAGDVVGGTGTDIRALYATSEPGLLFLRVDVALNAPPVAQAQSATAVAGVGKVLSLSGSDYENATLTYAVITPPAHGVLSGSPPNVTYTANAGYGGADSFTFKANDGTLDSAPATVSLTVQLAPAITSANATTFLTGQAGTFTVTATAAPGATITIDGGACVPALPASISFAGTSGSNTATFSGTPAGGDSGSYVCPLRASNSAGDTTQSFTLTLGGSPVFTSANTTAFAAGTPGSFTVQTTATPATTGIAQTGTLPTGVSFVYNGPGTPLTATLAGTPVPGTGGAYPLTLTAANGITPNTVQNFTLTVNEAPAVTSANAMACTLGAACSFTVATSGYPHPVIARGGVALPGGMSFVDNSNGTGTLSGTPPLGSGAAGTHALTFTATNLAGSSPTQNFTLTVNPASQTVAFTSTAPADAKVGGATYTVAATASSGLAPVTFSSGSSAVCTVATNVVSFVGAGTCTVRADQGGNADYAAAPQVQQSFSVTKSDQTISFTSTAPPSGTVGGNYVATATATSGLAVTITGSGACSGTGTVTFNTAGTCTVSANQAGNANYNAAPQVQQAFTVFAPQAITFTSSAPTEAVYGGTYNVAATATSGMAVALTVDAASASVCSIAGNTVSFGGTGTCTINANQPGGGGWLPAPQVQQSFAVGPNLVNDSYAVVGNTQLVAEAHSAPGTPYTSAAAGVLSNDASNVAITVAAGSGATTQGGSVTIDAAGRFTYTPPVGFTGADAFTYTGASGGVSRTATITFNVGNMVWYVNSAAPGGGNGRSHAPLNSLPSSLGQPGHTVYVHSGAGTTTGAFNLQANQKLVGAGAALAVGGLSIPAGSRPMLAGTLSGVPGAAGITVSGVNFNTGGNHAVVFTNVSADFVGGGMAITTTSGAGFSANSGGTVTVQGPGNTISTGTGPVLYVNATTIGPAGLTFESLNSTGGTLGGITLRDTGNFNGLRVTGVGTVAGSGGTIANKTQRGGWFQNTRDLTLNYMAFNNNGTNQETAAICGDALNGTNTNCGAGIHLEGVTNVSLIGTTVTGGQQIGINGNNVNGLAMTGVTVDSVGNENLEDGVQFVNLTGTVTITNSTFKNSYHRQFEVQNSAGTLNLTANGNTFEGLGPQVSTSAQGVLFVGQGTAVVNGSFTGSLFRNNFATAFTGQGIGNAQVAIDLGALGAGNGNTFTNNSGAVQMLTDNAATMDASVVNNTITVNGTVTSGFTPTTFRKGANATGLYKGVYSNNTVGNGTVGSGTNAAGTNGLSITNDGTSGGMQMTVTNNMFQNIVQRGMEVLVQRSDQVGVVATNNTFGTPDGGGLGTRVGHAIFMQSATNAFASTLCAEITGNNISSQWWDDITSGSIRLRMFPPGGAGDQFRVRFLAGTTPVDVVNYLNGANTNALTSATTPTSFTTGAAACF